MKKKITILFSLVFISMGGLFACSELIKDVEPEFDIEVFAKSNSEGFIAAPEPHLIAATQKRVDKAFPAKAFGANIAIKKARIEQSGKYKYLIAEGVKEGKSIAVAIELLSKRQKASVLKASLLSFTSNSAAEELNYVAGDTHTCTGAPCSSCDFTKEGEKITGCACNDEGNVSQKKCNHTVSGGDEMIE
jgi:hypothetical protein